MISLKPSVRLLGLRPEMLAGWMIAASVYATRGWDCIVTTATDGAHMVGSKHYAGTALDFRMHHITAEARAPLVDGLRAALGPDFDVLWESRGTPNEHVHVEWDPKTPY